MRVMSALVMALGVAACGAVDELTPNDGGPAVASVMPAAGAVGVNPAGPIEIRFTHPMMQGMEQYVALHEGETPAGPVVAGQWTWSEGRSLLRFTPGQPLRSGTRYVIHLGGGLRDSMNRELDHGACSNQGAVTVTPEMMSGAGMMGNGGMMGQGWQHSSGTYGMLFRFTTA